MNIVYAMTHHVYWWILPSIRSLAEHEPDARVFILAEDDELPFELPMPAEIINISGQEYFPQSGVNYYNDFKYINLLKVRYPSSRRSSPVRMSRYILMVETAVNRSTARAPTP